MTGRKIFDSLISKVGKFGERVSLVIAEDFSDHVEVMQGLSYDYGVTNKGEKILVV